MQVILIKLSKNNHIIILSNFAYEKETMHKVMYENKIYV